MNERAKKMLTGLATLAVGIGCPLTAAKTVFSPVSGLAAFVFLCFFWDRACRVKTKKDALLAGVPFVLGYCVYFFGAMGRTAVSFLVTAVAGTVLFCWFLLAARVQRRWDKLWATLSLPVIWLAVFFLAQVLRVPSLARVDLPFIDMVVLLQPEKYIGAAGVSFLLLWLVSVLRFAFAGRRVWCALPVAVLLTALFLPGLIILYPNVTAGETVRVAYATGPYVGDFQHFKAVPCETCAESMERSVATAAARGAELLVFTEEAFAIDDTEEAGFLARCAAAAKENGIAVLVGLDITDTDGSDGGKNLSEAILFGSDGTVAGSYEKSRLIPIVESGYKAGDGTIPSYTLTVNGKTVKIAWLICYDSNFTWYTSGIAPDTDLILLPSWDWQEVTELHANLCRSLAVRCGACVLKPTYDGLTVAIAPDGTILSSSSTAETGYEQMETVDMPVKSSLTYTRPEDKLSTLTHAVIGTEIMAVFVCLVIIVVTRIKSPAHTPRSRWFVVLAAANLLGSAADAVSWILDGSARLNTFLYVPTVISMLMTLVMVGMFCSYLNEYIKERKQVPMLPMVIGWTFSIIAVALTLVVTFTGDLFTLTDGTYSSGPLYGAYVFVNALSMLIGLIVVSLYRNSLSRTDRTIAYVYMVFPVLIAVLNLFFPDWSFAYPTITISILIVYAMLQSDKMELLEQREQAVSFRATHDELTGLGNRRAFTERAEAMKGADGSIGVIFGDVNGLKTTNDNYGHEAGDRLIVRFADTLSAIFRAGDIYRTGGDEFICLIKDVPEDGFNERVRELETVLAKDEPPIACIGAVYGSDRDVEILKNRAEALMYGQKKLVHERYPSTKR